MRKKIQKFWPIFFIFLIWFIFSAPYFLKNKVPYPSNYQVNFVPPWSYYDKFWGPVKNNAMPDIVGQIYPWRYFSINMWKSGEIAFWNPYSFSGSPHLANYQSAVFSPFNFLFFVFPFIDAWSILVLLQPFLAGFFMYLLMKEFKVSAVGSLISSISFMFCGFIVVWMAYGTLSMAIAFLPLSMLALEKSFKKINFLWPFVLSLSIPLSFFSGHFQTSLYFFIFIFLFFIFKIIQTKDIKKTIFAFLSITSGIAISLVQILPSIEFYLYSVRSEIFITKGNGIPFSYLVTIFAPDFFGNSVTRNDWFGFYAEWASFIGIIPLSLSFFAFMGKKKIEVLFFFIAGILFLLLAVESPVTALIGSLKIPVLSTSNPTRIIILFSFSFALLAGFGLDNLKSLIKERKVKKIIMPFLLIGILFLFIWILLLIVKVLPPDKLIIAKRNIVLPTLLFSGFLAITILSFINKKMILLFYFLLFTVSFDSLRFAQKWMPFDPKELVFKDIKIINMMKKNISYNRYFGNLGDQMNYYAFSSIEGYDPLYIGRYGEFMQSASNGKLQKPDRSVVRLDRNGKYTNRVLDLLGVNLIFHPRADTNQGWAYPVWKDKDRFSLFYKDDKFELYKNNFALGRATLFYDYEVIKNKRDIIERFYSDNFDFRKKVILEEEVNLEKAFGEGNIKIVEYSPNKIKIEVKTDRKAILFLSDNFYPGWKVKVRGKEERILRTNYSFRGVIVPKGFSNVEFFYGLFF